MRVWAEYSLGNLGRTGDYCSSAIMAMAAAADWFGQDDPAFGENIRRYYEHVRENDLLLTHTLVFPQANRSVGPLAAEAARRSRPPSSTATTTASSSAARGCSPRSGRSRTRSSSCPRRSSRARAEDAPYSYAFALPCDAPGLRFLCRESFDLGRSHFDHPLGSRFEEIDAIVVFDDVLVPWERCFVVGQPELCNGIYSETSAAAHMTHQVVTRTTREDGVHPRPRLAADRGDRDRAVPARPGEDRRDHHRARDVQGARASRRGRRAAEPLRSRHAGLGAAERVPQLVSAHVPALRRDPAAARGERADGAADGGRRLRPRAGGRRALPAERDAGRAGAPAALPSRLGHVPVGVRRAPVALRVLLLRRSGPDGGRARRRLRPRAVSSSVSGSSWTATSERRRVDDECRGRSELLRRRSRAATCPAGSPLLAPDCAWTEMEGLAPAGIYRGPDDGPRGHLLRGSERSGTDSR